MKRFMIVTAMVVSLSTAATVLAAPAGEGCPSCRTTTRKTWVSYPKGALQVARYNTVHSCDPCGIKTSKVACCTNGSRCSMPKA